MCLNPKLMVNPNVWRLLPRIEFAVVDGETFPYGVYINLKQPYDLKRKRVYELVKNSYLVVDGKHINIYFACKCNKCKDCLFEKQTEIANRCLFELQDNPYMYFFTLTYDDEHLPSNGYLCKDDVSAALKRFRSNIEYSFESENGVESYYTKKGSPTRHPYQVKLSKNYLFRCVYVGEYGKDTYRPHYHGVMFMPCRLERKDFYNFANLFRSSWKKGQIFDFQICEKPVACCKYITKYLSKQLYNKFNPDDDSFVKPFIQTPRQCGLGSLCVNRYRDTILRSAGRIYLTFLNYQRDSDTYFKTTSQATVPKFLVDKIFPSVSRSAPKASDCVRQLDAIKTYEHFIKSYFGDTDDIFRYPLDMVEDVSATLNKFGWLQSCMRKPKLKIEFRSRYRNGVIDFGDWNDFISDYTAMSKNDRLKLISDCVEYLNTRVVSEAFYNKTSYWPRVVYTNKVSDTLPDLTTDEQLELKDTKIYNNLRYIERNMFVDYE